MGGPQGATGTTTPRRLCAEGVIITEDAGGGASWDEAGARSTGTSVAAAANGRVFLARDRRSDPGSWRLPAPRHCPLLSSSRRAVVPQPRSAEATAAAEVTMSPGFRRAVTGQGAAAAVQLLVTLSFLSSLVKTQVSPRTKGRGRVTPASPRGRGAGASGQPGIENRAG